MNNIHWALLIANAQAYICDVCTLERYAMCTDTCAHLHSVHISYLYLHRTSHWWHPCFALHTFPLHQHIFVSRHCIVCNAYIHEPTHDALQMSPLIHTTCCMLQFLHFTIYKKVCIWIPTASRVLGRTYVLNASTFTGKAPPAFLLLYNMLLNLPFSHLPRPCRPLLNINCR